jgi:hypothetical protein
VNALSRLLAAGAAAGVLSAFVFDWTTDRVAIRRAVNLILAHVLEFRLFLDEPIVILRAQLDLFKSNARLLRLMLLPALILTIPSILLFMKLNALYGRAPLRVGDAVVVSAKDSGARLTMPRQIRIESPPVHNKGEVAWRIRPLAIVPVDLLERDNANITIPFPAARILRFPWLVWFSLGFAIASIGTVCLL